VGWTDGRNIRIDQRWGAGYPERIRRYAAELVALAPDVVLASAVGPRGRCRKRRPGGNATGFTPFEYAIAGKWLEVLKEIAPSVTRAAVLRNVAVAAGPGQFGAIQASAPSLGMEVRPISVRDADELERSVAEFARQPNDGLIVVGGAPAALRRDVIIPLAARHRLPRSTRTRYSSPMAA
jgi:putative ABC transport system substrate-binding protein